MSEANCLRVNEDCVVGIVDVCISSPPEVDSDYDRGGELEL